MSISRFDTAQTDFDTGFLDGLNSGYREYQARVAFEELCAALGYEKARARMTEIMKEAKR